MNEIKKLLPELVFVVFGWGASVYIFIDQIIKGHIGIIGFVIFLAVALYATYRLREKLSGTPYSEG